MSGLTVIENLVRRPHTGPGAMLFAMFVAAISACAPADRPPGQESAPEAVEEQIAVPAAQAEEDAVVAEGAGTTTLVGTVRYRDLEGGLYIIESGGTNYSPIDLPAEFQVDGLEVEAEVRLRDDVAGIGMVGETVEIVGIERVPDSAGTVEEEGDAAEVEGEETVEGDAAATESEAEQADDGATAEQSASPDETADTAATAAAEEEAPAATAAPMAGGDSDLWGSAWQLQDLGGRPAMSQVQATLEFPAEGGRALGNASCNRFFGQVGVDGDAIRFIDVGTMRMSCPPAINDQEQRFLAALEGAERFELEDTELRIFEADSENPIRFSRIEEEQG